MSSVFASLFRYERLATIASLALVVVVSAIIMQWSGDHLMMVDPAADAALYFGLVFAMWWTMMMAMMLPTALPALLTDSAISRRFSRAYNPLRSQTALALGYATIWTAFALAAALLNIAAANVIRLTPMMAITSKVIGILLLIAAGLYQLTPAKQACLVKCQSPFPFKPGQWRDGLSAAYRRGVNHGLYCTGCCGMLMVLLFYGGVMEVNWIGGLALYVLVEKLIPAHWRLHQFTGLLLLVWAAYTAISLLEQ